MSEGGKEVSEVRYDRFNLRDYQARLRRRVTRGKLPKSDYGQLFSENRDPALSDHGRWSHTE